MARLTPQERRALFTVKTQSGVTVGVSDRGAVDYAASHAYERASVISDKQLWREALRFGVGAVSVEGVQQETRRADILSRRVNGRVMTTTRQVLAEERALIAWARDGRGACKPLAPGAHRFRADFLNHEQRAAVEHVLHARDRVILLRGAAGTGKTTLMREAVEAIEAAGRKTFVFAPSSQAARGVLRQEGFAQADTVASLLTDPRWGERVAGQALWIDEAGLLGAGALSAVFRLAERQGCRVVLAGDIRQHGAVERGDALRLIETQAGIRPAEVTAIQRQKGTYKQAIEALSRGDAREGFDRLERLGALVEIADGQARAQRLAAEYAAALHDGKRVLAISPTHAEGARITDAIRAALKRDGRLDHREREVLRLEALHFTQAQKTDARNYAAGMVAVFHQNAPGFQRGEQVRVIARTGDGVTVARGDGREGALPLHRAADFDLFAEDRLSLARGDRLRVTRNGFSAPDAQGQRHRLNNGAVVEVAGFTAGGDIRLGNGWVIPERYGHLAHGYVVTSHAAQGMTVDRVFIAQSAASFPASSREQFYVSCSRGREQARIFTDDKAALKAAVDETSQRMAAVELAQAGEIRAGGQMRGFLLRHLERMRRIRWLGRMREATKTATASRQQERGREQGRGYE